MVKGSEASVRLDSVGVEFGDERLVASAGLVLVPRTLVPARATARHPNSPAPRRT